MKRRDANKERNDVVGEGEQDQLQATRGAKQGTSGRRAASKEPRKTAAADKVWKHVWVWVREVNTKATEAASKEVATTQRLQNP